MGLAAEWVILGRAALAALLGGVIGWERLSKGKWAGVRTLALVALASALLVGASGLAVEEAGRLLPDTRADPIRAIQAVSVGIGFLGAGIIHVQGDSVRGLTTAASVWATAAMGIAAGLGRYLLAAGAAGLLLVVLRGLERLEPGS